LKNFEIRSHELTRNIYGIDFSGAKDAGKKIWIAGGSVEGNILHIETCLRATELPGAGSDRERCLKALRGFIANETDSSFGFDFPFGLPLAMNKEERWYDFVIKFPERYESAGDFREKCRKAAPGKELKRITDIESRAPFSPYNLRVYRQTYYGIRDILNPLVHEKHVRVLPMQQPQQGKAQIIEICPASTLKKMNIYRPYKGSMLREQRMLILKALENTSSFSISDRSITELILDDIYGDALDSVIAAYATFCAWCNHFAVENVEKYDIEGYVFE